MLSVCIPVYNVDVTKLVSDLNRQIITSHISGEVIVLDDGSNEEFRAINRAIKQHDYVRYYEQDNMGRSVTRNRLAAHARYEKLIFIDSDCNISEDYLSTYNRVDINKSPLVIGGLYYGERPKQRSLRLRWNYGKKREEKIEYGNDSISFLSSNFMIKNDLFQSIGFNESIKTYGHEDTLFGIQLRLRKVPFTQINNKVEHAGLEPASIFLEKTKESVRNLIHINSILQSKQLDKTRIISLYNQNMPGLAIKSIGSLFTVFEKPFRLFLNYIYPSIYIFDIYKLLYLYKLKDESITSKKIAG